MTKVPYVEKRAVTVLAIGDAIEPPAVRAMLEGFGYLVTVQWIGSREELLKIFRGELRTEDTVVISGHGGMDGFRFRMRRRLGPGRWPTSAG
ncbi:hypothetical protein [Kribbella sp. C-35]|uniref:hypothetical protein n=1 Tax=Kribbella sp. C-35 TaxID=2789276 RepID=UPI00397E8E73